MISGLLILSLILLCLHGPRTVVVSSICSKFPCTCTEDTGFTYVDCDLETHVNSSQPSHADDDANGKKFKEIEILTIRQKGRNGNLPNYFLYGGYKIKLMEAVGLNLTSLSPYVFDGVHSVKTLYLSVNRLYDIEFNRFSSNFTENLESLILNNNSFKKIPIFNGFLFKSLSYLDLSSNKIRDSKQIVNLQSLETLEELNLGSNILCTINFNDFSPSLRRSLKRLKFDANKIENITDLGDFPNLTHLSLYRNKISQLGTNFFKGLPSLEALDLSSNKIMSIPRDSFKGLYNLEWLTLANNKLSTLNGDEFEDLKTLNLLELQNNGLEIFRLKWLKYTSQLITLDLSKNSIETIEFEMLPNLSILRLSDNKIKSIGEPVNFLPDLKRLYIDGNKISQLPRDLTNLVVLDASNQNGALKLLPDNAFIRRNDGGLIRIYLTMNPGLQLSPKSFCFDTRFKEKKLELESEYIDIFLSNMTAMSMYNSNESNICKLIRLSTFFNETRLYIIEDGYKSEQKLAKNHIICSQQLKLSTYGISLKNCDKSVKNSFKHKNRRNLPFRKNNKIQLLNIPNICREPIC